jgi:hypothetical protein
MDDFVVERAKERVGQRADGAALDALLGKAREQVEALASATSALEATLPALVGDAVRDEAQPMGRNLAEIRGLMATYLPSGTRASTISRSSSI